MISEVNKNPEIFQKSQRFFICFTTELRPNSHNNHFPEPDFVADDDIF
jgi:hypothetical protein